MKITDNYIDEVIKANQTGTPDPDKTSGIALRQLIKKLRDKLDIEQLEHVAIVYPEGNQLMRYNNSSGNWENWTPNFLTESDLGDVLHKTGDETKEGALAINAQAGLKVSSPVLLSTTQIVPTGLLTTTNGKTMRLVGTGTIEKAQLDGNGRVKFTNSLEFETPAVNSKAVVPNKDGILAITSEVLHKTGDETKLGSLTLDGGTLAANVISLPNSWSLTVDATGSFSLKEGTNTLISVTPSGFVNILNDITIDGSLRMAGHEVVSDITGSRYSPFFRVNQVSGCIEIGQRNLDTNQEEGIAVYGQTADGSLPPVIFTQFADGGLRTENAISTSPSSDTVKFVVTVNGDGNNYLFKFPIPNDLSHAPTGVIIGANSRPVIFGAGSYAGPSQPFAYIEGNDVVVSFLNDNGAAGYVPTAGQRLTYSIILF